MAFKHLMALHLDPASAERWSEAFFKTAGPQIRKCLEVRTHGSIFAEHSMIQQQHNAE